jgi:hypothetical protein
MKKQNKQPFSWSRSEQSNQNAAYEQISEIAEEHGIEVFFSGGEQFADRIEGAGLKPKDFSVDDFEKWKQLVVDHTLTALIEAERKAFQQLIIDKNQ